MRYLNEAGDYLLSKDAIREIEGVVVGSDLRNEPERMRPSSEWKLPLLTLRDLPLLLIAAPLMLLLGAHLAAAAMLLRKWTRIPYAMWMVSLYLLISVPLVLTRGQHSILLPLCAIAAIQLSLLGALALKNEWNDGHSFEMVALPHIVTLFAYLWLPGIYAAMDKAAAV